MERPGEPASGTSRGAEHLTGYHFSATGRGIQGCTNVGGSAPRPAAQHCDLEVAVGGSGRTVHFAGSIARTTRIGADRPGQTLLYSHFVPLNSLTMITDLGLRTAPRHVSGRDWGTRWIADTSGITGGDEAAPSR